MKLCRNSNTCEGHVTDHATRITRNCRLGKLKQMKKSTEECDTNFFITVLIKKRFLLACLLRDSLHNRRFKRQVRRTRHFAQNAAHKDLLCRLVKGKVIVQKLQTQGHAILFKMAPLFIAPHLILISILVPEPPGGLSTRTWSSCSGPQEALGTRMPYFAIVNRTKPRFWTKLIRNLLKTFYETYIF